MEKFFIEVGRVSFMALGFFLGYFLFQTYEIKPKEQVVEIVTTTTSSSNIISDKTPWVELEIGEVWRLQDDNPFETEVIDVEIVDFKEDWVQFKYLSINKTSEQRIKSFVDVFEKIK